MEISFYYNRVWESLVYVLVVVSWKCRQLWEYLQQSNPEGAQLIENTPPNPKTFTPVMRSRRLSSRRTIPGSSSVYYSRKKLTPIPKHLSKNLFDEAIPTVAPPPNKDLFAAPPVCDEQSVFYESVPIIPTPSKKVLFAVSSSCDERSEEEELLFQPIRLIEELSRDL